MRPIDVRDPDSPLGLTFGQELQDRIERELESLERPSQIRGLLNRPGIRIADVPPSERTVKNLRRRGRVIE
jgi:hypothetical protein